MDSPGIYFLCTRTPPESPKHLTPQSHNSMETVRMFFWNTFFLLLRKMFRQGRVHGRVLRKERTGSDIIITSKSKTNSCFQKKNATGSRFKLPMNVINRYKTLLWPCLFPPHSFFQPSCRCWLRKKDVCMSACLLLTLFVSRILVNFLDFSVSQFPYV